MAAYAACYGLFAPAGTRDAAIPKIHKTAVSSLKSGAVLEAYRSQGLNATAVRKH